MEELIERVSAATGLEPETSRTAVGMVLRFLQREAPSAASVAVFDKVPGAREAAAGAAGEEDPGGLSGVAGSGLMGLAGELGTAGLGMGEMQTLGREMFAYLRAHAGDDAVGELAGSIPGLGQFM